MTAHSAAERGRSEPALRVRAPSRGRPLEWWLQVCGMEAKGIVSVFICTASLLSLPGCFPRERSKRERQKTASAADVQCLKMSFSVN